MKDPYVLEDGTLKNKLGITDYELLKLAERDVTFSKFLNIQTTFARKFDTDYICSIHKHIFEDIFDWAGEFRTVPLIKEEVVIPGLSLEYSNPSDIRNKLDACLERMNSVDWDSLPLDKKSVLFTEYLTEIWSIHPFRDGNTRTTLTFGNQFAKEHNFPLNLGLLLNQLSRKTNEQGRITRYSIRDKFVLAAIPKEHFPEPQHLELLIREAMVSGISQHIEKLQTSLDAGCR